MSEYNKQAEQFLKETDTGFKAEFLRNGLYFDDKEKRDIYQITLKRGDREYKFKFGTSINNSGLRLFLDKEKTKRTEHKNFVIPNEIMEKEILNQKERRKGIFKSSPLRFWFEKEHFNLSGLFLDYGKSPTPYDVLACLQKYEVGSLKDFCGDFGYDEDSKKAEKTYKAVVEEFKNIQILFSDEEIEKLQEIQ